MPQPSTFQSSQNSMLGMHLALNSNGLASPLYWAPPGATKTAAYTCLAKESGTFFVTTGATAAVTFTLPPISDGPWIFFFIAGADVNMNVAADTVDTLVTFNDLAADNIGYETASELIGGAVMAYSDGTSAFGVPLGTGGHVQTLTVNT